ncbi:hypothetical protein T439DRAFT_348992 [Meredithblackwellia eburnea MCA 4105]
MTTSPAQTMPKEVLSKIFSFLHDTTSPDACLMDANVDLYSASLVCKAWNPLARDALYRDLHLTLTNGLSTNLAISKAFGTHVRTLSVCFLEGQKAWIDARLRSRHRKRYYEPEAAGPRTDTALLRARAKQDWDQLVLKQNAANSHNADESLTSQESREELLEATSLSFWDSVALCQNLKSLSIGSLYKASLHSGRAADVYQILGKLEILDLCQIQFGEEDCYETNCLCVQHILEASSNLKNLMIEVEEQTFEPPMGCVQFLAYLPKNIHRLELRGLLPTLTEENDYDSEDDSDEETDDASSDLAHLAWPTFPNLRDLHLERLGLVDRRFWQALVIQNLKIQEWPKKDLLKSLPSTVVTISIVDRRSNELLRKSALSPKYDHVLSWNTDYDLPNLKCVLVRGAVVRQDPMEVPSWDVVRAWRERGRDVGLWLWLGASGHGLPQAPSPQWFDGCWKV